MTEHQRARRARKSKAFFARLAERAALAGNKSEAIRLETAALRKRAIQKVTTACIVAGGLALAACTPTPKTVAVGLDCQGEAARVYSADSAAVAARDCRTVEIHRLPG